MAVGSWHRLNDPVVEMALSDPCLAMPADALALEVPSLQCERRQLS